MMSALTLYLIVAVPVVLFAFAAMRLGARSDELSGDPRYAAACARLQRMTERRRNSYEIQDYRKRRAAALKGLGRS